MPEYSNADNGRDSGGSSTFGQSLKNFINTRLPYQSYGTIDTVSKLNPKYRLFQNTGSKRTEALSRQSVSSNTDYNNLDPAGIIGLDNNFTQYMYANIQHDKISRLRDYRVMAAFAEVADALDEICDECINKDHKGKIVSIEFHETDLDDKSKDIIEKEFQKFIGYFDLQKRGWEYFRNLLIDGEVYFEHIIHKDYSDEGILGVVTVPTELIDPIFGNVQNLIVKGFLLRKPIFDKTNPNKITDFELIPLDKNQVTYINSGIWNENKTIRLPFIENARRAYRQLSLIEDSIIIYRLARSPTRLIFNVDVGNMPPPKAEAYLKRLMQQYWSTRTFDVDQGGKVKKFNPQGMLDNFWFAKRAGSEGTDVKNLDTSINLGELPDLMYFLKKLYKSLKVPVSRLNSDDTFKDDMNILREELKFARFIIRMQQHFAEGLKNGFITHLRLRKMWDEYELKETQLDITFNVPINFFEMREIQKLEIREKIFTAMTQGDSISKTYAQKKVLGWSDTEIKANREFLRKDKELAWELAQIENGGPNWRDALALGAQQPGAEAGAPAGGGGLGSTEPGIPPEFGPAPTAGGEVPVAGAEAGGAPAPEAGIPAPPPGA
jgi:hypothetical protein